MDETRILALQVEGLPWVEIEDDGKAMIMEVGGDVVDGEYVRLMSWHESGEHAVLESLRGRNLRITVEVIEHESVEQP